MPELTISGFDKLTDQMTIKVPSVLRRMAFNVDANLAAEGRKKELRTANKLRMGEMQKKGKNDRFRVRSEWDPNVGWVSNTRRAGNGNTGYRMASFGWERARKYSVTAPYSNQLANLWHRPTKPYRWDSPEVGRPGETFSWRKGQRRPVRYSWSKTYQILASLQGYAVAKTEAQFASELKEM